MQEFLVLGLVPGTNIQITFWSWLIVISIGLGLVLTNSMHRRKATTSMLVTLLLIRETRRVRA